MSYNKWTGPLERAARALPPMAWNACVEENHAFLRYQPEGRSGPQLFAVRRWRDGLFDRYGFVACDEKQSNPALTGERHRLKGAKEQLFSEVLGRDGFTPAALFGAGRQRNLLPDCGAGL